MTEFSSIQEMLEKIVFPKVKEISESLKNEEGSLKMTTTWLVNNGEELVFAYEKLNIPFKNMYIIVNTSFFKPWGLLKSHSHPNAYHELSKNSKWESIDTLVKRGEKIVVNPISLISLISCFKGRCGSKKINLTNVLEHITYSPSEKKLLVILSSEEDEEKKRIEIEDARSFITSKNQQAEIAEFKISKEGGGYYGFQACF